MTKEDREATLTFGRRLDNAREGLAHTLMLSIMSPDTDDGSQIVAACRELGQAANSLGDMIQAIVDKSKTDPEDVLAYIRTTKPPAPGEASIDAFIKGLFPDGPVN
jgi:hypothetical protein